MTNIRKVKTAICAVGSFLLLTSSPAFGESAVDSPNSISGTWVAQGPGPAQTGQVEGITDREVVGAVHAIAAHPSNASIIYVGGANGGVWKTTNGTSASPNWTQQTDTQTSLSIGALEFDPNDGTGETLVAGIGRYSSFGGRGGARTGLLRTTNGGTAWTAIDGGLATKNISGVAPRGSTIVASANSADSFTCGNIGVFRSVDSGATFTQVGNGSGLAVGVAFDLATDRSSASTLYTGMTFGPTCGALPNGIYKSSDTGATWTKVSSAPMDTLIADGTTNNIEIAANGSNVFVNIIQGGRPVGVFHSGDSGASWTVMDLPKTPVGTGFAIIAPGFVTPGTPIVINSAFTGDHGLATGSQVQVTGVAGTTGANGNWIVTVIDALNFSLNGSSDATAWTAGTGAWSKVIGMNPKFKPGGQGGIHASIVADPSTPGTVYLGGDRQDAPLGATNFIKASDYSGRLFRGNSSTAATGAIPSPQWHHLTHSNAIAATPAGGTAGSSAPHADSREMVFDANGNLLESDDGGIYRRTSPGSNTGDWFSINGDLQVNEQHNVAYDEVSDIIISGNQDTGTTQQKTPGSTTWDSIHTGDGGDVAVDSTSIASMSTRYSSFQNFQVFRRRAYDSGNVLQSQVFPSLTVTAPDVAPIYAFTQPIAVNGNTATRLVIGARNAVYESLDQGDTLKQIAGLFSAGGGLIGSGQNALAYGAADNVDALYVGTNSEVWVRSGPHPAPLVKSAAYPGTGTVLTIAMDPDNWQTAFAIEASKVYATTNGGASWTDITGDLTGTMLQSAVYVTATPDVLLVGGGNGVFQTDLPAAGTWTKLGSNLPNAPVFDLDFSATDNVVVAGTLGRGAWKLTIGGAPACFALTRTHTGSGTDPVATPSNSLGCTTGQYTAGASINVTATPDGGWSVGSWVGTNNDASTSTSNTVTMPASPHTVTVNYTQAPPICFALTLNHTGSGTDPVAAPSNSVGCTTGQYTAGASISLTATPDGGWSVGSWVGTNNDASTSTSNTVTMPAGPHTATVNYTQAPPSCFALTRTHTGSGTDPVASPSNSVGCTTGQYTAGASISLTASPDGGWSVASWVGTNNDASTSTSNSMTMPASPHTVTVNYTEASAPCFALTRTHTGSGTDPVASPAVGIGCPFGHYTAGYSINVTASPDGGWSVGSWSGTNNNTSTSTSNSVTMPAGPHTVTVNYVNGSNDLTFQFTFCSAVNTGASARGFITFNQSLLSNPFSGGLSIPGPEILDLSVTVAGASSGNGTFTLNDFGSIAWDSNSGTLNFGSELVGQPTAALPWGTTPSEGDAGDFNLFPSGGGTGEAPGGFSSDAPSGTFFFTLSALGGNTDTMVLKSMVPGSASNGTANCATPQQTVLINEVLARQGENLFELFNPTASTVNLDTLAVTLTGDCGQRDYGFVSFELAPGAYVGVIGTECWSSNSAGSLALFENAHVPLGLDFVRWGGSPTLPPPDTHWVDFGSTPPAPPDDSKVIGRGANSLDTNQGSDWCIQNPTLGFVNPGCGAASELKNLSTRADVGTGPDTAIAGFIIRTDVDGADAGISEKCVVVRGRGPSMNVNNVSLLMDPTLTLYSGQTIIAENDNWGDQTNPADKTIIENLGLAPPDFREAALYKCLPDGPFTAFLRGNNGGVGVGIVEVFDADDGTAIMENISTRARVGSGPLVTIGGFIIEGSGSLPPGSQEGVQTPSDQARKILVRGRGPSVGVPSGVIRLNNPRLRLYQLLENNTNVLLEENDNWQQAANASDIAATGQAPPDPSESAILMMLEPGVYTGIVDGIFGATGTGIIEVIDLTLDGDNPPDPVNDVDMVEAIELSETP